MKKIGIGVGAVLLLAGGSYYLYATSVFDAEAQKTIAYVQKRFPNLKMDASVDKYRYKIVLKNIHFDADTTVPSGEKHHGALSLKGQYVLTYNPLSKKLEIIEEVDEAQIAVDGQELALGITGTRSMNLYFTHHPIMNWETTSLKDVYGLFQEISADVGKGGIVNAKTQTPYMTYDGFKMTARSQGAGTEFLDVDLEVQQKDVVFTGKFSEDLVQYVIRLLGSDERPIALMKSALSLGANNPASGDFKMSFKAKISDILNMMRSKAEGRNPEMGSFDFSARSTHKDTLTKESGGHMTVSFDKEKATLKADFDAYGTITKKLLGLYTELLSVAAKEAVAKGGAGDGAQLMMSKDILQKLQPDLESLGKLRLTGNFSGSLEGNMPKGEAKINVSANDVEMIAATANIQPETGVKWSVKMTDYEKILQDVSAYAKRVVGMPEVQKLPAVAMMSAQAPLEGMIDQYHMIAKATLEGMGKVEEKGGHKTIVVEQTMPIPGMGVPGMGAPSVQ